MIKQEILTFEYGGDSSGSVSNSKYSCWNRIFFFFWGGGDVYF